MNWGHYRFRKMRINKAALNSSCQVIIYDEHYASRHVDHVENFSATLEK